MSEADSTDDVKSKLESLFPEIDGLEYINKGMFGHAFIGSIGNDLVVAKLTNSISEFWLTQMAIVSDPPHTVKFRDAKEFNSGQYQYGIVHDHVSKDALPDKRIWNIVSNAQGENELDRKFDLLSTKEERYEFNMARKYIKELKDYFGLTDMDTLHQNWGYDDERNLVIYDLDGYVRKHEYEAWMAKHK